MTILSSGEFYCKYKLNIQTKGLFRNFDFFLIQSVHKNGGKKEGNIILQFSNALMRNCYPDKFSVLSTSYIMSETSGSLFFGKGFVYTIICTYILIYFNLYAWLKYYYSF